MYNENVLIGKTITGIKIADDKLAILFQTTEGDIIARAEADCCSYTWIEHISLPAMGFPAKVMSAEDVNMPDDDSQEAKDGERRFYGFQIATDKGIILIDYRNDSNGYYGGSLSWDKEYFYGGVHGQNISKENWIDIVE